jgi:hypothetical protein
VEADKRRTKFYPPGEALLQGNHLASRGHTVRYCIEHPTCPAHTDSCYLCMPLT